MPYVDCVECEASGWYYDHPYKCFVAGECENPEHPIQLTCLVCDGRGVVWMVPYDC